MKACLPAADITQQKSNFPPKCASIPECVCDSMCIRPAAQEGCFVLHAWHDTLTNDKKRFFCLDWDSAAHFLAKNMQHKCLFLEGQCS